MADARLFGLVSDTHGYVHPDVFDHFDGVEAIYHAGDVCGADVLAELEAIAPVLAVAGNCDMPDDRLPLYRVVEAPFGRLVIAHGHLVGEGYGPPARFLDAFGQQEPRVVLYGHSHQQAIDYVDDVWIINPGAAGKPRFRTVPSLCVLHYLPDTDELRFDTRRLRWPPPRK